MKTIISTLFTTLLTLPIFQSTQAQKTWTARDSAAVTKLEKSVKLAEDRLKKTDDKVHYADSLILTGTTQLNTGKSNKKELKTEKTYITKQYNSNYKTALRLTKSDDKADVNKARNKMKEIKAQYRVDDKDLANRIKANDKLISMGNRNISKGKSSIKDYKKSQKEAEAGLNNAKENLNNKLVQLQQNTEVVASSK